MREKIIITTTSFARHDPSLLAMLEQKGFDVTLNTLGRKLKREEIVNLCSDYAGIIAGTEKYDRDILSQLPGLKVISRCGTGLDSIDLVAAKGCGIRVYNTPDAPTLAVAELTVGLILNLLRMISQMDADIRNKKWDKKMGYLLAGKKVGIIGYGRIGQKVGNLLAAFDTELAYCDVEEKPHCRYCGRKEFEEVLGWADIVTLHLSQPKEKKAIIGYRELMLMKKGAWIVNVSRGNLVDETALYDALKSGHLSGAALDVFEKEPYSGPFEELKNVLLTPHIGSYAREARIEMETQAVKNLLSGFCREGEIR